MKRNGGLDILKLLCAFLVICIHCPFPGIVGSAVTPLTRIAVPIFFMITGYYYSHTKSQNRTVRQIKKILKLLLLSLPLYCVFSFVTAYASGTSLSSFLSDLIAPSSVFRFLCLNEPPFGGHLWYLCAILYVLVLLFFFEKKWDRRKLYPLVPFLLLTDLVFGKYSLLILGFSVPVPYVRNFLFVGLPYFLIGDMLYRHKPAPSKVLLLFLSCLFIFSTWTERYFLGLSALNADRDHYLSTTFLAISLFLLALRRDWFKSEWLQHLSRLSAGCSTSVYLLHPIVITVLYLAAKLIIGKPEDSLLYSFSAPFLVLLFSILLSQILACFSRRLSPPVNR